MIFTNLNVETKTLRIISLILTLIGIIFILASKFIGVLSIRIAMVVIFLLCLLNFKAYSRSNTKEKINNILAMASSILIFVKPQFTMFIVGAAILLITIPVLYKIIKNKDYSDKLMLVVSAISTLFALYCIINSKAALNTVIIVIGIAFVILGCLLLFESFDIRRTKKYATFEKESKGFEEVE